MSLSGIRDTSTIRSPPPMRMPINTTVAEFSEDVVRSAIKAEIDRGGQCFVVLPRIKMIPEAQEMLERLVPGVDILIAHGQMSPGEAESVVGEFAEGKAGVLLATTVIENGIDIPTVNTIVVLEAQSYGMSTLYQLRGRVGRNNQQAFA